MKCVSSLSELESQTGGASTVYSTLPTAPLNYLLGTARHHNPRRTVRSTRPNRPHPLIPPQTQESTRIRFRDNGRKCSMGSRLREILFFDVRRHHGLTLCTLPKGEHEISINHKVLGKTCGLLPVGVGSTVLTTRGLRWNLSAPTRPRTSAVLTCIPTADHPSHFDGMVSTSNHLLPEEPIVYVKTTEPIWWTAELRPEALAEIPSVLNFSHTPSQRTVK